MHFFGNSFPFSFHGTFLCVCGYWPVFMAYQYQWSLLKFEGGPF